MIDAQVVCTLAAELGVLLDEGGAARAARLLGTYVRYGEQLCGHPCEELVPTDDPSWCEE